MPFREPLNFFINTEKSRDRNYWNGIVWKRKWTERVDGQTDSSINGTRRRRRDAENKHREADKWRSIVDGQNQVKTSRKIWNNLVSNLVKIIKFKQFRYFRYAQGANSVSVAKIPADSNDAREFKALKTLTKLQNHLEASQFELETHVVDKESNHVEPINWFGILVPQSLKTARDRYENAIELVIESVNVQQRLKKNCQLLEKLKCIKVYFESDEE